ncbi:MAG TPA: hypothetical protein PKE47_12360 [Verrucomicrobiota bacterium]|nr:hypothetical protein [Verrucomicrobiota bacterium]
MIDAEDLLQRFLSYAALDTQADPDSATTPSSEKQWPLLRQLEGEPRALGLADMRPVELALEAMRRAGLEPFSTAIRGGTDGARLTERGLPAPNHFAGFNNIQSGIEWASVEDMVKSAEVLVRLTQLWEERA